MKKIRKFIYKDSLQSKLIIYVIVVIAVLIGISSIFSSAYFSKVTRERLMRDYSELIDYSSMQLNEFYNELKEYGIMIASDERLQETMSTSQQPVDKIMKKYRINELLKPYAMMNNNLISVEIQEEGIVYSSESANKVIYREREEEWEKLLSEGMGFSEVHTIYNSRKKYKTISFIMPINNYYDNKKNSAVLYLNVRYEKFEEKLKGNLDDYNWIILVSETGEVIYSQSPIQKEREIEKKVENIDWDKKIWGDNHEIYLKSDIGAGNMQLMMSITDEHMVSEIQTIYKFFLRLFGIALLIGVFGVCLVTVRVTASIKQLTEAAHQMAIGNKNSFVMVKGNDEVAVLGRVFNEMIENINTQMKQIKQAEKEKNELKMDILMTQINPHFIYNTLNSAIYLSKMGENRKVEQLIRAFVQLLQENMKNGAEGIIATVEEEEHCIRNYLEIQSIRYPGRFISKMEVDQQIRNIHIPRLLLQPFVENALNHGILTEERMGEIVITMKRIGDMIHILIQDNGVGMEKEVLERVRKFEKNKDAGAVHSIGISNVNERLKLMYKKKYQLQIYPNKEAGMTVSIMLPMYF